MSIVQSVVCDGCGKVKGETNHWLVELPAKFGIRLAKAEDVKTSKVKAHYCGQSCASAAFQQFLDGKAKVA